MTINALKIRVILLLHGGTPGTCSPASVETSQWRALSSSWWLPGCMGRARTVTPGTWFAMYRMYRGMSLVQVVSSCNVFQHTYLPRVKFRDHPCGMAHGTAIIWRVNGLMFKCHACTNQHWKSPFCGNCPRLSFVTRKVGSSTIIFLIVTSIKTKTPKTHQKRAIPYQKLQSFTILQHTLL